MKLATLKTDSRDGRLLLVSRDLTRCVDARAAITLQQALDNWTEIAPLLREEAGRLEAGEWLGVEEFAAEECASPLPRAYQWADGSAYVNHVELVRKARGAEMPPSFYSDPLMYQGGSDSFLGPCDDIAAVDEAHGIDFESEVAVITDDVPMGTSPDQARQHIKLLMLVNDWSLRNLIPAELAKGFGFYQSKPATTFSPVAVTPDELGEAWDGGKVNLPLSVEINGKPFGKPEAGIDMTFDFPRLISHVTKTRNARAGTIVGSGTISNYDRSRGSACLAERRTLEQIEHGKPLTPFLKFGDRVRIEMLDAAGRSVFGAIDQKVVRA
jgi:fumarylacetoacetate (FAA) hydrolase